jgi:hypothetical protein
MSGEVNDVWLELGQAIELSSPQMAELAQVEQEGPGTGSTEAQEGSGDSGDSGVIFYWAQAVRLLRERMLELVSRQAAEPVEEPLRH